jgi:hypothetical protein
VQSVRHTLCTREQAWNFPVAVAANAQSLIEIDQLRREILSLMIPDCESLRMKNALRSSMPAGQPHLLLFLNWNSAYGGIK